MTAPARIRPADIDRLIVAGQKRGFETMTLRVEPDGTIIMRYESAGVANDDDGPGTWDDAK
jgi:hypothetical protein